MRPQRQVIAGVERDALLGQHLVGRHQHEVGMRGEELHDDRLVLRLQHAAGRIDQATARLHQARGAGEDRALLGREFLDRVARLAPLEVGIAAQRAQPAAGRVDQHAVDLAGQSLDLGVVLAVDQHRVDVGQPAARQARLELGQALLGHVEGIEAPGRAHRRAQRQGLAARAGAEVDHHLAAARRYQRAEQLAALVLHLDQAVLEDRQLGQGRLADHAHAVRRERGLAGLDAGGLERVEHLVAGGLLHVHAQVQRRRVVDRGRELREPVGIEALRQRLVDPVGQVGAHAQRQAGRVDLGDVVEPGPFGLGHMGLERRAARRLHQPQQGQAARRRAGAALGQVRVFHLPAQHREHRLGDHATLGMAELGMRAEEPARGRIGRAREFQYVAEQRLGLANQKTMQLHTPSPCLLLSSATSQRQVPSASTARPASSRN